ncbi:MAG: phage tail tape measure protein, partial [Ruminococcus sp.]|nr:phage tail tape measure protein [Ruminococcus sp.]
MAGNRIKGITIQIGADTTGLDTALQGIEKAGKNTRSELREVDSALKKAPESAELWRQKQELLTKAVEDS